VEAVRFPIFDRGRIIQNSMSESNKVEKREEERGEKNNEFSGHFVCHAACLQRRTGSACTSLRPSNKLGLSCAKLRPSWAIPRLSPGLLGCFDNHRRVSGALYPFPNLNVSDVAMIHPGQFSIISVGSGWQVWLEISKVMLVELRFGLGQFTMMAQPFRNEKRCKPANLDNFDEKWTFWIKTKSNKDVDK
jgi:hypothetical protein